ncbi:MAG: 23S rRNA pseudouridine(955/2504/2580) synthase, partial [Gammaproteobacteria bacterium]|nr:23S rRNA pseudouridine(955/2504/2580) synthase [Gammaproteobacteria bacterium]
MPYAKTTPLAPDPPAIRTPVRHFEVSADEAGQRLDNYLQRHLEGVPRSRLYRLIRKGEVRVNGRRSGPDTRLVQHDRVRIPPVQVLPRPDPGRPAEALCERMLAAVVYEDEKL